MRKPDKKVLDFLFISGPLGINLTGGDKIMIELANRLKDSGYKVGILFVPKIEKYLVNDASDYLLYKSYLDSIVIQYKLFSIFFHNKIGIKLLRIIRKIRGETEGITGIEIFNQHIPDNVISKRTIAVGWRSAYVLNNISFKCNKYYLIQHDEDHLSYSGSLHTLVSKTYSFNFKKIVYNSHLKQRFYDDDPILIKAGLIWLPHMYILPEQRNKGNVLFVLREGDSKGSVYALKAALELSKYKGMVFRSFGDYKGKIPKFVKHFGWADNGTLSKLFNWASIFVIPSIIEGFSLTTAEAMHAGCAIIASDCIGVREIVKNEINGFIVPPKNPKFISDKILELIRDDKIRLSFANAAMHDIIDYTFDNTYREFIEKILQSELSANSSDNFKNG